MARKLYAQYALWEHVGSVMGAPIFGKVWVVRQQKTPPSHANCMPRGRLEQMKSSSLAATFAPPDHPGECRAQQRHRRSVAARG